MKRGIAWFDGGVRGNPGGPTACGVVLEVDGLGRAEAFSLGHGSNNTAEASGLIAALKMAAQGGVTHLTLRSDSKLIVEQALGNWRIKDKTLRELHAIARELAAGFESVKIDHVRREKNTAADALCTKLLDDLTGKARKAKP